MNDSDTMPISIASGIDKFEKSFMEMLTGAAFRYYYQNAPESSSTMWSLQVFPNIPENFKVC
jgi:hypothetical protein